VTIFCLILPSTMKSTDTQRQSSQDSTQNLEECAAMNHQSPPPTTITSPSSTNSNNKEANNNGNCTDHQQDSSGGEEPNQTLASINNNDSALLDHQDQSEFQFKNSFKNLFATSLNFHFLLVLGHAVARALSLSLSLMHRHDNQVVPQCNVLTTHRLTSLLSSIDYVCVVM